MCCRLCVTFLILLGVLALGCLATPAHVGSDFADVYSAFAPLYALYRSYAEYLFHGSAVMVAPGLESACQSCSTRLENLQMGFISQIDSPYAQEVGYVVRLRERVTSFCDDFRGVLTAIASAAAIDLAFLAQAAEDDLFVSISDLNTLLEKTLNLTVENLEEGADRWLFNAAFSTRTLMNQETIVRIDAALEPILLGSEETSSPPQEGLPDGIIEDLHSLAGLAGHDLSCQEGTLADTLARSIHAFLIQ